MSKISDFFKLRGHTLASTKVLVGDTSNVAQETATTGSGSVVLATSPTLVTPALGTPSALVATNATGTATGLTAGISNALKSATTTVDVSAATAPTNGQVLTATAGTTATWQTPSAGSGDLLATLLNAEVSITGTGVTGTISKMHVCSGTSADYTVTLPAASGNTGKFIGFRMATGLTKLVTIDGNASETIDGATTRVMWAGESCILLCDGSNWFKIAGKSKPMMATLRLSTNQTITTATITQVTLDTSYLDNTGLMNSTGANTITIKRAGNYLIGGKVSGYGIASNGTKRFFGSVQLTNTSGATLSRGEQQMGDGAQQAYPTSNMAETYIASVGDVLILSAYAVGAGSVIIFGSADGIACALFATEVPTW